MKKFSFLVVFLLSTCSLFAQDSRISLFLGRANRYASVELSDYRRRLCMEYDVSNRDLDEYYRHCGNDWGNVGIALEISRTSGRRMRDVCDYYNRYRRHGWVRILVEIGIRPESHYYHPFYDRLHHHSDCWEEYYVVHHHHHHHHHHHPHYKKHHNKHHKYYYKKRYHHDDDDDDDDD